MDLRISSVHVAQGRLEAIGFRFEKEEVVGAFQCRKRRRDSKLEWHVESRESPLPGTGNATQVMNGRPTTRDEAEDAVEATPATIRNFEHAPRLAPQSDETRHQGDKNRLVFSIEGNVEKDASFSPSVGFQRAFRATFGAPDFELGLE